MQDPPINAVQTLIAKLHECVERLPHCSAEQVIAQTEEIEALIRHVTSPGAADAAHSVAEMAQVHESFSRYAQALARSQGRVARALNALGHETPVYSESDRRSPLQLPVAGVRRTSVSA